MSTLTILASTHPLLLLIVHIVLLAGVVGLGVGGLILLLSTRFPSGRGRGSRALRGALGGVFLVGTIPAGFGVFSSMSHFSEVEVEDMVAKLEAKYGISVDEAPGLRYNEISEWVINGKQVVCKVEKAPGNDDVALLCTETAIRELAEVRDRSRS